MHALCYINLKLKCIGRGVESKTNRPNDFFLLDIVSHNLTCMVSQITLCLVK